MLRYRPLCTIVAALILVTVSSQPVHADTAYSASLNVIDSHSAELRITYPVSAGVSSIPALSTKKTGPMLDSHWELVSANGQDGSARSISHNTDVEDAQIALKSGDQSVTLVYKLSNILNGDISLFNFLLFLGGSFPSTIHVSISAPAGLSIVSHTSDSHDVARSDGGADFDLDVPSSTSSISAKNLTVLVYPSQNNGYAKRSVGRYEVVSLSSTKLDKLTEALSKASFASDMFKAIIGSPLPDKVYIAVVPLKGLSEYYEAAGITLPPNIILIDPNDLSFDQKPNDLEKTVIHELAHVALMNSGIFSGQAYHARWFDEGVAVFGEQHATDNFILKDEQGRVEDAVLSDVKKMDLKTVAEEYLSPFDFDFRLNTGSKKISRTYPHAGMIMYNLYLRDQRILPKVLADLKAKMPSTTCGTCDTDTILSVIRSESGLSTDDIIYPYKNALTVPDRNLAKLVLPDVDPLDRKKIEDSLSGAVGSYVDMGNRAKLPVTILSR